MHYYWNCLLELIWTALENGSVDIPGCYTSGLNACIIHIRIVTSTEGLLSLLDWISNRTRATLQRSVCWAFSEHNNDERLSIPVRSTQYFDFAVIFEYSNKWMNVEIHHLQIQAETVPRIFGEAISARNVDRAANLNAICILYLCLVLGLAPGEQK